MKRLAMIALLTAAPFAIAASIGGTTENTVPFTLPAAPASHVEWQPIAGPADALPEPAATDSADVQGLTVHEWGTFTSVAGPDGTAIDWSPAGGPTDLPCFVSVSGAGPKGLNITEQGGRSKMTKVRMETPVLYFYSPEEQTVNVKVSFPRGLMTEWYPSSAKLLPNVYDAHKAFPDVTGTIQWTDVQIMPGATASYPFEENQSHYYAARRTASAPLKVGAQFEKFLFYRGIADFSPPIKAQVTSEGKIAIANLGTDPIPAVVLFENRGGKIGYRIERMVNGSVHLEGPKLDKTLASLQNDLESVLRSQGMFAMEARAMVDTWKDTWFEHGARVFYIVPGREVDSILPLSVTPEPISVARAFVGRMEVLTPATQEEVRQAILNNDKAALQIYGRFLEPAVKTFLGRRLSAAEQTRAMSLIAQIRAEYVDSAMACTKKNTW